MSATTSDDPIITVSAFRLQQLELDAQRAQLLQKRVDELESIQLQQQALSEKHADVLMQIARTCDNRVHDLEAQHAAALASKDAIVAKLEDSVVELKAALAAKDVAISELKKAASMESAIVALKTQSVSKLAEIHTAVAALQTLEIFPIRPADSRQFASWHNGPVPLVPVPPVPPHLSDITAQPLTFDRTWATAAVFHTNDTYKVDVDMTGARLSVVSRTERREDAHVTIRSAAPLPRPPLLPPQEAAASADALQPQPRKLLPAYRVVIEAYSASTCELGFIPSHLMGPKGIADTPLVPKADRQILSYGGWYLRVHPTKSNAVDPSWNGWVALPPFASGIGVRAAALIGGYGCSDYATTDKIPPVPAGSAVEFAVDYASGTCRVAFYTPAAVADEFADPPYAKMELRFIAREAFEVMRPAARRSYSDSVPSRPVPTAADSRVSLYPAVCASATGVAMRFV